MKTKLLLSLFLLKSFSSSSQNLVPNPSFEINTGCPQFIGQIDLASGWNSFAITPDYFNSCALSSSLGVPINGRGYQNAHTGNAYAGILAYRVGTSEREYIGVGLAQPLIIGQKYFCKFYVSLADASGIRCATNKIGLNGSTLQFSSSSPIGTNNLCLFYSDSIIQDTSIWTEVSGYFYADSAYSFISIGNFFDNANTDTIQVGGLNNFSYYFVDDVCISSDSNYWATWTGLKEMTKSNTITISPNPVNNSIKINGIKNGDQIKIYNTLGRLVLTTHYSRDILDVKSLAKGIYLLRVTGKENTSTLKFIKKE